VSATEPAKGHPAPSGVTPPAQGEKVAHTFEDDAKMGEFTSLWQQRVGMVTRMTVLQGYWNTEQGELAKLNSQLQSQYQLEPTKDYYFNKEKRALMERKAPEAAAPVAVPATGQAGATPPAKPSAAAASTAAPAQGKQEDTPIHTFADEEELKGFAALWQQRQGMAVRMAVLQDYWKGEQNAIAQLNNKLSTDYGLDVTKDYTLDNKRRVLIERPAPPAAPAPSAATPAAAPKNP